MGLIHATHRHVVGCHSQAQVHITNDRDRRLTVLTMSLNTDIEDYPSEGQCAVRVGYHILFSNNLDLARINHAW